MSLFPMFLKLEGRRCLVVGAGTVAEAKIESLLATEAAVRVVAPHATPKVREWARQGRIESGLVALGDDHASSSH